MWLKPSRPRDCRSSASVRPRAPNGSQDLSAVRRVAEQIGAALKHKDDYHVIVMRSTIQPGAMDLVVKAGLESTSGKKANRDFGLCFQPEFLREGTSIKDYDNPPFTVIGTEDERAAAVLREVFGHLPGEFLTTSIGVAEMLKYACNAFHAVKITFANEIGRLAQSVGVDSRQVMELVCKDQRLNISPAYLKPGFAFGGSCLPKDLRALTYVGKLNDVTTPMLGNVMGSNRAHIDHALDLVMNSGKRKVGMIGLSFKAGTDDLRESPLVTVAERLIGKGYDLQHLRSGGESFATAGRQQALHRAQHSAYRQPDGVERGGGARSRRGDHRRAWAVEMLRR